MIGRVILPGTGLNVSRLSFGTASLHHLHSSRARQALLQAALDIGITHFDTSPYYGFCLAERELGVFHERNRGVITMATKVGLYPPGSQSQGSVSVWTRKIIGKAIPRLSRAVVDWSVSVAEKSLQRSLKRLKTARIDLLLLHEPSPQALDSEEFLSWLDAQERKGTLRYWGLAGNVAPMAKWLAGNHPLGRILQVKDSLSRREADVIAGTGRELQITYGYFHASERASGARATGEVLTRALQRNKTGSVLFSTRRRERLAIMPGLESR